MLCNRVEPEVRPPKRVRHFPGVAKELQAFLHIDVQAPASAMRGHNFAPCAANGQRRQPRFCSAATHNIARVLHSPAARCGRSAMHASVIGHAWSETRGPVMDAETDRPSRQHDTRLSTHHFVALRRSARTARHRNTSDAQFRAPAPIPIGKLTREQ